MRFECRRLMVLVCMAMMGLVSCRDNEIVDIPYPDQKIYLPAAVQGIFYINSIAEPIGNTPVPGYPYRYLVDLANRRFNIPLAVYRSGVDNKGGFDVQITLVADTVTDLMADGSLPDTTLLLPAKAYNLPEEVVVQDGDEIGPFTLSVDLDFLRQHESQLFALGIHVASGAREANDEISTAIIAIDTRMLHPVADFQYAVDETDGMQVHFTNQSLFSVDYQWDFGDGSDKSTEEAPSHVYSASGTYPVTLTATGITGQADESAVTFDVIVP